MDGDHQVMTTALAQRIERRMKQSRMPMSADEEQEVIMDWLSGATRETLQRRFNRGQLTIRRIIEAYQTEAIAVLAKARSKGQKDEG